MLFHSVVNSIALKILRVLRALIKTSFILTIVEVFIEIFVKALIARMEVFMKIFKRILLFLLIVILVIVFYFGFNGYILYKEAMDESTLEERISSLQGENYFTPFSEMPSYYIDAVICIEDHRFYSHSGVDYIATIRALRNNLISMEAKEGGSSITQQVAKNLCFTQEKTLYRKVAELFVVPRLEKDCSKEEIFELYVNNMYFGSGYYNIYDASMRLLW